MHGYFDLLTDTFHCEAETVTAVGKTTVKYFGDLFLGESSEKEFVEQLANNCTDYNVFKKLSGQFAFAIFDNEKKKLTLIRDQFGVVPLYYSSSNGKVLFGTDIKSILRELPDKGILNQNIIHEYFSNRYVAGRNTFYKGIYELQPGTALESGKDGMFAEIRYYKHEFSNDLNLGSKKTAERFEEAFIASLERQTSDWACNNIGVLSSGGIDSSILVSLYHNIHKNKFNTYYIGLEGYKFNRIKETQHLSEIFNAVHEVVKISNKEFADNLIETIYLNEEPLNHPCSVPRKYLCQKLGDKINVLLSGEGADCLYGGYYIFGLIDSLYVKNKVRPVTKMLASIFPDQLVPVKYKSKLSKIMNALILSPHDYSIQNFDCVVNNASEVTKLVEMPLTADFLDSYKGILVDSSKENVLNKLLQIYQTHFLVEELNTIFKLGYRYGVWHRHPFIDAELVNFFNSLPWGEKIRLFERKYLVNKLGKKYLPREIYNKPKEGFGVPLSLWFYDDNGLGRFIDLLGDKKTHERGVFNKTYLNNLLNDYHKRNLNDEAFECIIWPIINFELWCRVFLDDEYGML